MTTAMQFEFAANTDNNTITIKREFAAKRQLVWDCYTKSELLDQWFAPKPFSTKTKSMDFSEGGHWHYAMVDPQGTEYWGYTQYQTIRPIENYTSTDSFSDESGKLNPDLPSSDWDVTFIDYRDNTLVHVVVTYHSREEIEKVMQMGMQAGMTSTLERLDELLLTLNR